MKFQGITVIKRKDCNTWYARYRKDGKQHYISANTQKDCYDKLKMALLQKIKQEIKELKQPKQKQQITTLLEWFNEWLSIYKKDVKQKTKKDFQYSMQYLKPLHNMPLDNIKTLNILKVLNSITFERRKQTCYDLLKVLFTTAIANELIIKNPILSIEKPKHKKENGLALTNEDEIKLEKICLEENLDLFLVCLYQGLRRGEALALTGTDINLEQKTLTINKSLNEKNEFDTTKNCYSNRIMPLFDKTIPILQKYIGVEGRIFDFKYKWCDLTFQSILKRYDLNKKYSTHSLRHTFITRCQEKNIPLHIIQKWVGHNIGSKVTNAVYTHTRNDAELENIRIYNEKSNSNRTQ